MVSQKIFFWEAHNAEKRKEKFTRLENEIFRASENPSRFGVALIFLYIMLMIMTYLCPFSNPIWVGWQVSEQLAFFSTIWTIQATMVALVYPIVISFIAVYLQRRPTSETFLNLYMLYSGVMAAGVSSLSLVSLMGVQYLLIGTWGTAYLTIWASLDTVWFLLNAALTTLFLYRTVAFLRPEVQQKVVCRYALNIALVKDMERSICKCLWTGDIPGVWDGVQLKADTNGVMNPYIQIGWASLHKGTLECEIKLKSRMQLANVRLWLIRFVVKSWCKKANLWMQEKEVKSAPILILGVDFGLGYIGKVSIAKVVNGPGLTYINRILLRFSFKFKSPSQNYSEISIDDIFLEISSDVRGAIIKQDYEVFKRALGNLVDFHKLMLSGSLVLQDDRFESLAMLPSLNSSFFSRGYHEEWIEFYRDIVNCSIDIMEKDNRPIQYLCNLLLRFDDGVIKKHPVNVHENLFQLSGLMMYQLGNWWSYRIDVQGSVNPILNKKQVLRQPYFRIYEEVISSFVSGWENAKPEIVNPRRRNGGMEWGDLSAHASLCVKHIDMTAKFLISAIDRGDLVASEWMADVLWKWCSDSNNYHIGYLNDVDKFVTIDDFCLSWQDFCSKYGLIGDDFNVALPVLVEGIFINALKNYISDLLILVFEILLERIRSLPTEEFDDSLAASIVIGMIQHKQWKPGSLFFEVLFPSDPEELLIAKFRQTSACYNNHQSYLKRLDDLVEKLRDSNKVAMISSRVYSFSFNGGVESLIDSSLEFLFILTESKWSYSPRLLRKMSSLICSGERGVQEFNGFERFIVDLNNKFEFDDSAGGIDFVRLNVKKSLHRVLY